MCVNISAMSSSYLTSFEGMYTVITLTSPGLTPPDRGTPEPDSPHFAPSSSDRPVVRPLHSRSLYCLVDIPQESLLLFSIVSGDLYPRHLSRGSMNPIVHTSEATSTRSSSVEVTSL